MTWEEKPASLRDRPPPAGPRLMSRLCKGEGAWGAIRGRDWVAVVGGVWAQRRVVPVVGARGWGSPSGGVGGRPGRRGGCPGGPLQGVLGSGSRPRKISCGLRGEEETGSARPCSRAGASCRGRRRWAPGAQSRAAAPSSHQRPGPGSGKCPLSHLQPIRRL